MPNRIEGDTAIIGHLSMDSATLPANSVSNATVVATAAIARSKLAQDTAQSYAIPWDAFRVHDAYATVLPGTAANDDLGLVGGTFGSASPSLQTQDRKAGSGTNYARLFFQLPPEYDAGETVTLRLHAGMLTTVSDTTATIDAEVYKSDREAGVGSDICATAAQSINSLTLADKDFTITPSGLSAGDWLDIRLAIAITDSATGTAVIGIIGEVALLLDVRG